MLVSTDEEKESENRWLYFWAFIFVVFVTPILKLFITVWFWVDAAAFVFSIFFVPAFFITMVFEHLCRIYPGRETVVVLPALFLGLFISFMAYPFIVYINDWQFFGDADIFYSGYRDFLISAF